jgi:hypothetical protein
MWPATRSGMDESAASYQRIDVTNTEVPGSNLGHALKLGSVPQPLKVGRRYDNPPCLLVVMFMSVG